MGGNKRQFDACLLRVADGEYVVVKWDQLITTKDKSKLGIGSCAGYKPSNNKREKAVQGTIVLMGNVQQCEQQKKLLIAKTKKRKLQESESDDEDEEKNVSNSEESSESSDTESSDSDHDRLEIDEKDENDCHRPKPAFSEQVKINNEKQIKQTKESKDIPLNNDDAVEVDDCNDAASTSASGKRSLPSLETKPIPPAAPPKRSLVSLARLEELEAENKRLKKEIEKYRREWMPRPTDPAVIRYLVRMGELFSSDGEAIEEKGEKIANACRTLNVEEHELKKWHKPNGTKTARAIVRAFYPKDSRLNVTGDDLNTGFRQAIHDIINVYHGMEGLTDGKINESINNVFRSAKSQQKDKGGNQISTHSTACVPKTNDVPDIRDVPITNDVPNITKKKKKVNNNDKENAYRGKH